MQATKQKLISFFEQVAQKDDDLLKKLKQEKNFTLNQRIWCFSLIQLHIHLQNIDDVFRCIDYMEFQKLVFNSPINKAVKKYDAEITIVNNQGKVNKSTYALAWKNIETACL